MSLSPPLIDVGMNGEPFSDKKGFFLRQLSTGVYTTLSEKMTGYSKAEEENISVTRYQAFIVFLSLWSRSSDGDVPHFHTVANEWYANKTPEGKKPKILRYNPGEYTQLLKQVTPDEFMAICDYFNDQSTREWVEEIYIITDKKLQSTSEQTKEALKNE